ncbi:MAG: hypothetical protein DRP00_02045 [Candidatus Aenigmatarchaeota archaeon]|nr:MAG: hypothetical protein DRP00_02045 [Candidatus Aenigmarchaeota archaeon]
MEIPDLILLFGMIFIFFIILNSILSVSEADIEELTQGECNLSEFACRLGEALGLPRAWINSRVFLKYVVIPFLGICSVIYGFLDNVKIFPQHRINVVLAILIALSTIHSGAFTFLVAALFATLGIFSVIVFFFLFFFGLYGLLKLAFRL